MTELTKDDVLAVAYARAARVYNQEVPAASDSDEYLKQLQKQYLELRKQEYEYICMQQAYDTYLASRCVNDQTCRTIMFASNEYVPLQKLKFACIDEEEPNNIDDLKNSDTRYQLYTRKDNEGKIEGDSTTVFNAASRQVYKGHRVDGKNVKSSVSHHCAMTGLRIVTGISNRLGYSGCNNIGYQAWDSANAAGIHGKNYPNGICKGKYSNITQAKTLNGLIKSGEIGPGDLISIPSGGNNSGSGYHTLTVASINKNEKGEIIGYTLMDNNGGAERTRLKSYSINDPFGGDKNKPLYTKTHSWAYKKFESEIAGKSAEELEKMIAETKDRMCNNVIVDLARSELTLLFDKEYLKTCGYTLKYGIDRAPGLKNQQNEFVAFYSQHNAALIEEGKNIQNMSATLSENNNAEVDSQLATTNTEIDAQSSADLKNVRDDVRITKEVLKIQAVLAKKLENIRTNRTEDYSDPQVFDQRFDRGRIFLPARHEMTQENSRL